MSGEGDDAVIIMNDDLDIYGDLPNIELGVEIDRLQNECKDLSAKTAALVAKITELGKEKEKLEKQNTVLQKNMSILLNTAKKELKRKDTAIAELRHQIEVLRNQNHLISSTTGNLNSQPKRSAITTATQTTDSYLSDSRKHLKEIGAPQRHQPPDNSKFKREDEAKKSKGHRGKDEERQNEGHLKQSFGEREKRGEREKESSRSVPKRKSERVDARELLRRKRGREESVNLSISPEGGHGSGSRNLPKDKQIIRERGRSLKRDYERIKGRETHRSESPVYYRSRSRSRSSSPAGSASRRFSKSRGDHNYPDDIKRPRIERVGRSRSPVHFGRSQSRPSSAAGHASKYQDREKGKQDSRAEITPSNHKSNELAKHASRSKSPASIFLCKDTRPSYERDLDSAEEGELMDDDFYMDEVRSPRENTPISLLHQQNSADSGEKSAAVTTQDEEPLEGKEEEVEEDDEMMDDSGEEANWQLAFKKRQRRRYGPCTPTLFTQRMTLKLKALNELPPSSSPEDAVPIKASEVEENETDCANSKEVLNKPEGGVGQPSTPQSTSGSIVSNKLGEERPVEDEPKAAVNTPTLGEMGKAKDAEKPGINTPPNGSQNGEILGQCQEIDNDRLKSAQFIMKSLFKMQAEAASDKSNLNMPSKLCSAQEMGRLFDETVLSGDGREHTVGEGRSACSIPGLGDCVSSKAETLLHSLFEGVAVQPARSSMSVVSLDNSVRFNDPVEYTPFKNRYKLIEISPIPPKPGISVLAFHQMCKEEREKSLVPAIEKTEEPIVVLPVQKPTKPLMPTDIIDFIVDSEEKFNKENSQRLKKSIKNAFESAAQLGKSNVDGSLLSKQSKSVKISPSKDLNVGASGNETTAYQMNFYVPIADDSDAELSSKDTRRRSPRKSSNPVKRPKEGNGNAALNVSVISSADDENEKKAASSDANSSGCSNSRNEMRLSETSADFSKYRIPKVKKSSDKKDEPNVKTRKSSTILLKPGKSEGSSRKSCSESEAKSEEVKGRRRTTEDQKVDRASDSSFNAKGKENEFHKEKRKKSNLLSRRNSKNCSVQDKKEVNLVPLKISDQVEVVNNTKDSDKDKKKRIKVENKSRRVETIVSSASQVEKDKPRRTSGDRKKEVTKSNKDDVSRGKSRLTAESSTMSSRRLRTKEKSNQNVCGVESKTVIEDPCAAKATAGETPNLPDNRNAAPSTPTAPLSLPATSVPPPPTSLSPASLPSTLVTSQLSSVDLNLPENRNATPSAPTALLSLPATSVPPPPSSLSPASLSSTLVTSQLSNSDLSDDGSQRDKLAHADYAIAVNSLSNNDRGDDLKVDKTGAQNTISSVPLVNGCSNIDGLHSDLHLSDSSLSDSDDDDDDTDSDASDIVSMFC